MAWWSRYGMWYLFSKHSKSFYNESDLLFLVHYWSRLTSDLRGVYNQLYKYVCIFTGRSSNSSHHENLHKYKIPKWVIMLRSLQPSESSNGFGSDPPALSIRVCNKKFFCLPSFWVEIFWVSSAFKVGVRQKVSIVANKRRKSPGVSSQPIFR